MGGALSPPILFGGILKSRSRRESSIFQVCAQSDRGHNNKRVETTLLAFPGAEQAGAASRQSTVKRGTIGGRCSRLIQQRLEAALPQICESLLERARSGDVASARALWKMAEFDRKPPQRSVQRFDTPGVRFARKVLAEFARSDMEQRKGKVCESEDMR